MWPASSGRLRPNQIVAGEGRAEQSSVCSGRAEVAAETAAGGAEEAARRMIDKADGRWQLRRRFAGELCFSRAGSSRRRASRAEQSAAETAAGKLEAGRSEASAPTGRSHLGAEKSEPTGRPLASAGDHLAQLISIVANWKLF